MRRTFLLSALAIAFGAAPALAQSAADSTARLRADSTVHVLESVVVTATPAPHGFFARLGARSEYTGLLRENRSLERQLRMYDARVAVLEARLDRAKAVHDSLSYDIASFNEATAAVHSERMRLEALLRRREAELAGRNAGGAIAAPAPTAPATPAPTP